MCDVCVAERALWATRCGSRKCMAYDEGALFDMGDAPRLRFRDHPAFKDRARRAEARRRARRRNGLAARRGGLNTLHAASSVCVRARGKGAECKANYQIKLEHEHWSKEWTRTNDLAGSMGLYGLDVKWQFKPRIVQEWILGRRKKPTEDEIKVSLGLPKEFDSAPRPIKNLMRLSPRRGARRLVLMRRNRKVRSR